MRDCINELDIGKKRFTLMLTDTTLRDDNITQEFAKPTRVRVSKISRWIRLDLLLVITDG